MEKMLKAVPEMPREPPPGVISVPVLGVQGEGQLAPEYFYREAVPPPEVLQPPAPLFVPGVPPGTAPEIIPELGPPDTGPPA
jgi:hypothetical protein